MAGTNVTSGVFDAPSSGVGNLYNLFGVIEAPYNPKG